jgi:hypothetical protein
MAQQVGTGAVRGALYGGFLGASTGYQGGRGRFREITVSTLEGAAFGASIGALKPLVLGRNVTDRVAETLDKAEKADAAKGVDVSGVDVTVRTSGAWQWAYHTFGRVFTGGKISTDAMTIGSTMNVEEAMIEGPENSLLGQLEHELVHVWQAQQNGLGGYLAKYLYGWATMGYYDSPMEVQARTLSGH